MEVLLAIGLFGVCMAAMGLGVIVSGRRLRGSCGGDSVHDPTGEALSCGACPKKQVQVCPSDDPLVALSQSSHPDPSKHR